MGTHVLREITAADVGRSTFACNGRDYPVENFIGQILPGDVGKRVFLVDDDVVQVENDQQRATRLEHYQPKTGVRCSCRRGVARDNCPACEGTGMMIDFRAIHARRTVRS